MRRFAGALFVDVGEPRACDRWIGVARRMVGYGAMTVRPVRFWLYVAAGVVMIIASALALPFVASRSR